MLQLSVYSVASSWWAHTAVMPCGVVCSPVHSGHLFPDYRVASSWRAHAVSNMFIKVVYYPASELYGKK